MNQDQAALQQYLHSNVLRVKSDCSSAVSRLNTATRIQDVVHIASSVHPRAEIRSLVRRETSLLKQAAERRIDELLEAIDPKELHDAYRALCGAFPAKAQKARQMIEKANAARS